MKGINAMGKSNVTEGQEQQALFDWAQRMEGRYPELKLMYHVPNGGKRDKVTAAILKREGVKSGVPDICLPVPKGRFHGLYIELKRAGGKTTKKQDEWLEALEMQGYRTHVCVGWQSASNAILNYLKEGAGCR